MMQNITEELLIKNGYKEFKPSPYEGPNCTKMFQKCFCEGNKKLYFIDVKKWEFDVHGKNEVHWEAFVQLYASGSHEAMDVEFLNGWTLDSIERYVRKIYDIGFEPYE